MKTGYVFGVFPHVGLSQHLGLCLIRSTHQEMSDLEFFSPDLLVFYLCCTWGFRFVGREGIDQERLIPRTEVFLALYSQDTF